MFDMPEPTKLMVAGDWHNNSVWAIKAIKHAKEAGADTILHLGDFGYWPRSHKGPVYYRTVVSQLRYRGLRMFWVDGNHEDHFVLAPAEGLGNEVIRHLPRGHRWQWWGKTWMAVGGGVSVDKKWRTPQESWFPEETLTPHQLEYCLRDGEVDVVAAHDVFEEARIPGIHASEKLGLTPHPFFPAEQIAESWEHRELMSMIAKDKKPDWWFHGHYHNRYNDKVEVDGHEISVVGLDCDATHLNLNTVILTAKDLEHDQHTADV